jgi:hypothetical protein
MGKFVIAIGLVVGAISLLTSTIDSDSSSWNKAFKSLFIIAGAVAIAIAVGFAPITIIIGVIVGLVFILWKQFGSLSKAMEGLAMTANHVFTLIGELIVELMILPLRSVIFAINLIIKGYNELAEKTGKSTINTISMEKITGGLVPDKMYGKTRENWAERNAWIAENRVGSQGENNGKTSLSNNINNVFNIEGITDPEEVARKVLEKQNETMDMFQGSMDS